MPRVAVVGCGLFGACCALELKRRGHDVIVLERAAEAVSGASFNNQGRLHLGFHYPRDPGTVRQCIEGMEAFRQAFPDLIVDDFVNAYFIASEGSRTTKDQYLAFCDEMNLRYRRVDPAEFAPRVRHVDLGLITEEAIYDGARIREAVTDRMASDGIEVRYGTEIVAASDTHATIILRDAAGRVEDFDAVVNATYANASRLTASLGLPVPERQYEYVVVPLIKAPFGRVGITVMDGEFVTIMPHGRSDLHTLYHVRHSVLAAEIGQDIDPTWLDKDRSPFAGRDADEVFRRVRDACVPFVPALAQAELAGFLHGPRSVMARAEMSDARPSIVEQPIPRYISVFSGKVDHCIGVANTVADKLSALGCREPAHPAGPRRKISATISGI